MPAKIRAALEAYATERKFSTGFVIEMALSQFLDADGVTFEDCDPVLNPGKLREQVEILQYSVGSEAVGAGFPRPQPDPRDRPTNPNNRDRPTNA